MAHADPFQESGQQVCRLDESAVHWRGRVLSRKPKQSSRAPLVSLLRFLASSVRTVSRLRCEARSTLRFIPVIEKRGLTHAQVATLSAFGGGLLIWENVETGAPRHMKNVSRDKVLQLWIALSRGDIASIEKESWLPGYG